MPSQKRSFMRTIPHLTIVNVTKFFILRDFARIGSVPLDTLMERIKEAIELCLEVETDYNNGVL
ncbi:MAG: hypothetical protein AB7U45_16755 [Desulfamplus sp.]